MKKKLWIVSELYYPETTSTGYILTRIAEGLVQKGHHVNVLCGRPTYSSRGLPVPSDEEHNGVNIHRCRSTTLNKDVLPLRIFNLLTISFSLFFCAFWRFGSGDSVLVVTNPPSLPYFIMLASKLRRADCILLVHDVYPELMVAVGKLHANNSITQILQRLNQGLYRSVRHIIVLGRDMKELATNKLNGEQDRISIIPNWADLEIIKPIIKEQNQLRTEFDLQDKFVIEYAGNMGYPNDLVSIVQSAIDLLAQENICFLFIGSGAKRSWLVHEIETNDLSNIIVLPSRPREDQINFLNASDVMVISLVPGMKGVSVPSRTYNILAAGKPIIAIVELDSELALLVEEEQVGWVVSPYQPQRLVDTILDAYSDPERLLIMGKRARKIAEVKYSYNHALEAYHTLFQTLDGRS